MNRSLARATLTRMALRIAAVIAAMTALAYWHVVRAVAEQQRQYLQEYVLERAERERSIFKLTEQNQIAIREQLLARLEEMGDRDPVEEFDRLYRRYPDGVLRNCVPGASPCVLALLRLRLNSRQDFGRSWSRGCVRGPGQEANGDGEEVMPRNRKDARRGARSRNDQRLGIGRAFPVLRGLMIAVVGLPGCGGGGGAPAPPPGPPPDVEAPEFVMNLSGQTGWFAPPAVYDLDGDGTNELIAAQYDLFVFDDEGNLLDRGELGDGRVYAPFVVADLDDDGATEIALGRGHEVVVYEWDAGNLLLEPGWPADTTCAGSEPEIRGMAAGDLDGNGTIEIAVTTTQTLPTEDGGAQVFVFGSDGFLFQPAGAHVPAWPRYNNLNGTGDDADRNVQGHGGYGCYGLNIAIGDIDDDPQLEVIATYDNHHIQAFDLDGVALDASPWFTNRASAYAGERLTWGQFIRWADPAVEEDHYHLHTGTWPHPDWTEWLQWTASPPNVVDLDGDGRNEVLGVPNIERHVPYVTQAYGVCVLQGNHGSGNDAAMRLPGWEVLPRGGTPIQVDGWYPPGGVPAALTADLSGDDRPEIVVSLNDGFMHAFDAEGAQLWRYDYRRGKPIMYSSEPLAVDLNQDAEPEIVFSTYGAPSDAGAGYLVILGADGFLEREVALPDPGNNGNGNGAPACAVGDLDGDGQLEIFAQTFDHGIDIFTVPGSAPGAAVWPHARGNLLRSGSAPF